MPQNLRVLSSGYTKKPEGIGHRVPIGILLVVYIGLLSNTYYEERALSEKKVGKTTDLIQFHQLGNNPRMNRSERLAHGHTASSRQNRVGNPDLLAPCQGFCLSFPIDVTQVTCLWPLQWILKNRWLDLASPSKKSDEGYRVDKLLRCGLALWIRVLQDMPDTPPYSILLAIKFPFSKR